MATFAQPTPDENLVQGWNVQGNFTNSSTIGVPGQGFSQAGVAPPNGVLSAAAIAGAGTPQPPGALNIGSENAGSQNVSILTNPGYQEVGNLLGAITAPAIPASTVAAQNPSGLAAVVTITGGTVTVISTAPYASSAAAATFTQVGTTTPATVTVPAAGFIKMTYSVVPTSWSWVTTN